jgi:hypothetical protein
MANILETLRFAFLRGGRESEVFSEQLKPSEQDLLREFLKRFEKLHDSEFPKGVDVLVLLTGGMATGVHNKPVDDQDIDIAINFSSSIGTTERLKVVSLTESFLRGFLDSNELGYKQYTGLIGEDDPEVSGGYKGWILIEKEHGDFALGYMSSYPLIRFVTDKTEKLRPFEFMLWGVDNPDIEEQLKWQSETGKGYKIIWDTRAGR